MAAPILTRMERARTGPFAFVVPALVVLPLAGLALWFGAWRWYESDTRVSLGRRLSAAAAAVERQVDAAVQRQADTTHTLATSPTTWLWVKFQGERLTVSNRAHAEAALASLTSFSGLVPGASLYLASERTRTVYQGGAAVAALSRDDARDSWYAAALADEGVVVSGDPRAVRTSMRVMNGRDLLGAVSCVTPASALAGRALDAAADEPAFTFVLSDSSGAIVAARGPRAAAAATVFDLFDSGERARVSAVTGAATRPGELTAGTFSAAGRRVLAAATVTAAPGWRVMVASDLAGLPIGRTLLIAAIAAAALLLVGGALLLMDTRRSRLAGARLDSLERDLDSARKDRDSAQGLARELREAAFNVREATARLGERVRTLGAETAAGRSGCDETLHSIGESEGRSAELRSGIAAHLPLLGGVASGIREVIGKARESLPGASAPAAAAGAAATAAAAEEINVILTTGSAVTLALDNAGKGAGAMEEAAERARMVALNAALVSSRPGGRRQGSAQAADEMRRIAEDAAAAARSLASALEEARAGMRAVSRAAQEAGRMSHEAVAAAAPRATGGAVELDRALRDLEDQLGRLEAANLGAEALRGEAASGDRSRSAAEGTARIMERVGTLCGEIAALASTVSRESAKAASRAAASGS
jgi:hypothetical protein